MTDVPFFSTTALTAAGFSRSVIDRHLRRGLWVPATAGVYVEAEALERLDEPRPRHLLQIAAVGSTLSDDVAVSHESSAVYWRLPLLGREPMLPLFTRPKIPGRTPDRTRTHKLYVAGLPDEHLTCTDGLRLTSPARTTVDLARRRSRRAAIVTADAALRSGVTRDQLREVLAYCERWPGIRQARWIVEFADPRAESPLESLGRLAFYQLGLPAPRLQVRLGDDHLAGIVDYYFEEYGVVAEADGRLKYRSPEAVWAEKIREDTIRDMELEVFRFYYGDVVGPLDRLAARAERAFVRAARRRGLPWPPLHR